MIVTFVMGALLVVFIFLTEQVNKEKMRRVYDEGYHTWAIVVEYKTEFVLVAGSWTWLEYPQVDYITKNGKLQRCRLKYASSRGPLLYIGDEVEVVLHNGILYYKPCAYTEFLGKSQKHVVGTLVFSPHSVQSL